MRATKINTEPDSKSPTTETAVGTSAVVFCHLLIERSPQRFALQSEERNQVFVHLWILRGAQHCDQRLNDDWILESLAKFCSSLGTK